MVGKSNDENAKKKSTTAGKITLKDEAGVKYRLIDEIRKSPLMRKSDKDDKARRFINEHADQSSSKKIVPGQLVIFKYFQPKTKEDLEYYDASPCTIFFGVFNSSQGRRILGFNIHYYPPKLRYQIMNKIFELYRPVYTKYFNDGPDHEIDAFDYQYLVKALNRQNLGFGVREYIPELVSEAMQVPPNMWQVAVFTEGWFKKKTRQQIMSFWRKWLQGDKEGKGSEVKAKYKTNRKS